LRGSANKLRCASLEEGAFEEIDPLWGTISPISPRITANRAIRW
jgi:hypothetical protein